MVNLPIPKPAKSISQMGKSEQKVVISEKPKTVSLPPPLKPLKQDPKPKVAFPKITLLFENSYRISICICTHLFDL